MNPFFRPVVGLAFAAAIFVASNAYAQAKRDNPTHDPDGKSPPTSVLRDLLEQTKEFSNDAKSMNKQAEERNQLSQELQKETNSLNQLKQKRDAGKNRLDNLNQTKNRIDSEIQSKSSEVERLRALPPYVPPRDSVLGMLLDPKGAIPELVKEIKELKSEQVDILGPLDEAQRRNRESAAEFRRQQTKVNSLKGRRTALSNDFFEKIGELGSRLEKTRMRIREVTGDKTLWQKDYDQDGKRIK